VDYVDQAAILERSRHALLIRQLLVHLRVFARVCSNMYGLFNAYHKDGEK
jgi:hypothetical protein